MGTLVFPKPKTIAARSGGGGDQGDALVWGEAPNFFGYKTR